MTKHITKVVKLLKKQKVNSNINIPQQYISNTVNNHE